MQIVTPIPKKCGFFFWGGGLGEDSIKIGLVKCIYFHLFLTYIFNVHQYLFCVPFIKDRPQKNNKCSSVHLYPGMGEIKGQQPTNTLM